MSYRRGETTIAKKIKKENKQKGKKAENGKDPQKR